MDSICQQYKNILIVKIDGDIDHHVCEALRYQIDTKLQDFRCKHILFSFTNVAFMDSSGIGVLIGRYKLVQKLGGLIAVAGANQKVQQIFQLSALDKLFPNFTTEQEAIAYLEGGVQV